MKNINIDELLNSYLDDELNERQQTEVRRMMNHDAQITRRLRELEKCKVMVNSLPRAQAPAGMLDDVRASLERNTLLGPQNEAFNEQAGARDMLVRKILSAAAMIALAAVLGTVIYSIIAPDAGPARPIAAERWERIVDTTRDKQSSPMIMASAEFGGLLELKTADFSTADAAVKKMIEKNGLLGKVSTLHEPKKGQYTLRCSRKNLSLLLVDLESLWQTFESTTLFVDIALPNVQIAVNAVTARQVAEIINQDSFKRSVEVAKILAASDPAARDLIIPPKPVLTVNEQNEKEVNLTIVVTDSE